VIADVALLRRWKNCGIELIAPYRRNERKMFHVPRLQAALDIGADRMMDHFRRLVVWCIMIRLESFDTAIPREFTLGKPWV